MGCKYNQNRQFTPKETSFFILELQNYTRGETRALIENYTAANLAYVLYCSAV